MYFIVTSILIASFIFMFDLRGYLNIKTLQIRALIPSTLIVIYIISTIIFGDYPIYSFKDLLKELTNHPILILRLLVFIAEIEFFFFLVRRLTFVRSSNSNMLNDIVSKDEYINKNNERYFIYGGLLLFIIMMLHYIIPGKVIDTLATTFLIIISLFFTIIVLNYQSVYERLSAIVKFVDTKDDIILDAAKTPARIIRSKLNDWSNKTCMNINGEDLSLNAIAKQINIDSMQLYEFIKYEYGLNLEQ